MLSLFNRLLSPGYAQAFWIGIACMLLGNFLFALNDVVGKILLGTFAVSQVLAIRALGSFLVLGPMLYAKSGARAPLDRPWLQLLRVVLATADSGMFYAAVTHLPLADVMTFYMAGPIYVAAMSYFIPGERIDWRRWAAILVGFVGVVIALGPSFAAFSPAAAYAVVGSLCYSGSVLLNKVLSRTSDTVLGSLQAGGALIGGGAIALFQWTPPGVVDVALLLLLGIIACVAHLLVTRSLKLAPVSVLAPFQYTLLLWGIVFGVTIFGDMPNGPLLIGSAIIVVAGLFLVRSEAKARGRAAAATAMIKDFP